MSARYLRNVVVSLHVLLLVAFASAAPAQKLELHFIKIGQGDCTLVKFPNSTFMLVDCGSSKDGSVSAVRTYITRQLGLNPKIGWLVITHPDKDHYNLLPDVLASIQVGKVFTVDVPDEFPENDCDDWLTAFDVSDREILTASKWNVNPALSLFPQQGGASVHVLAANVPDTTVQSPKNTRSIVLKVSFGTFDAILTGDATFDTENNIMNRFKASPAFLDVELLKIGHHGSRATSTSRAWAAALSPEVAVVSSAYANTYGHPAESVITNLHTFTGTAKAHKFRWYHERVHPRNFNTYNEAIFCTARNGNIVIDSDGTLFNVSLK